MQKPCNETYRTQYRKHEISCGIRKSSYGLPEHTIQQSKLFRNMYVQESESSTSSSNTQQQRRVQRRAMAQQGMRQSSSSSV